MAGEPVGLALTLTLLAGLATSAGSAIAFFARRTNTGLLVVALGFSAGIMIYLSFVQLLPMGMDESVDVLGPDLGQLTAVLALFGGMLGMAFIDRLSPLGFNPHEMRKMAEVEIPARHSPHLLRAGLLTAAAIALHNFPEGIAIFLSTLQDTHLGLPVAISVAIHNIPEGIAVSIPIYYATGSRSLAFLLSSLSGLSEPLGALLAYLLFAHLWSGLTLSISMAVVAGIMIFIALDVLLPAAETYGQHHRTAYAVILGMFTMAASLWLLEVFAT